MRQPRVAADWEPAHPRRLPPARGEQRRRRADISLLLLLAVISLAVLTAAPPADAKPIMCGGAVLATDFGGKARCFFAASGSKVRVEGAGVSPAYVTYNPLLPVFPGAAWVVVTVTKPGGAIVVRCSNAFFVAVGCTRDSESKVVRGTLLRCSIRAYATGVGVAAYSCRNLQ
jgi:hypothetical protein